jgi:cytochrome c oxidase subunit 3
MLKRNNKNHLFHVLEPSLWPFFLAVGAFFFVTGIAFTMHYIITGYYILLLGVLIIIIVSIFWFLDISREAVVEGYHTRIVRKGLKLGFIFFIASEIMLFFGFFWAFFHSALCPSIEIGSIWPPIGLKVISVFDFPLFNTFVLIISGFSVTWAHRGISIGSYKDTIDGFIFTIILGFFLFFYKV